MLVTVGTLDQHVPTAERRHGGSFRDPAGYVFQQDGLYKRAVRERGLAAYRLLMSSGLYGELADAGLLIRHTEESAASPREGVATTLVPEQIGFVSYPYEWCFSQLRDAALLTLDIQRRALRRGLSLKDASAFNVQFRGANPVFIDTLSFEADTPGPWIAYRQFCREFLSPLLLMAYVSDTFNRFLSASPDGFPLDLTSRLLPWRSYLNAGALLHVHLHARAGGGGTAAANASERSKAGTKAALCESLYAAVEKLKAPRRHTAWSGYYAERTHYTGRAEAARRELALKAIHWLQPEWVFDLGANTGAYSALAANAGCRCVAFEMDAACAEEAYRNAREAGADRILPLRVDLRRPSPGLGLDGREHEALVGRRRAGLVVAMAILHHLRISGNVPLDKIEAYFAALGGAVLVEFVPKDDPMVRAMLAHREDIFEDYTMEGLLAAFRGRWRCEEVTALPDSSRSVLLFRSLE